jgi:hypothetical protein
MFDVLRGWTLTRSPLAPSVPLDGTETVEGLRSLERLHLAALLNDQQAALGTSYGRRNSRAAQSRRRRYQRFKGPFVEQLTLDDLRRDPRPWQEFIGKPRASSEGSVFNSCNVAASLDLLCERFEASSAFCLQHHLL